MKKVIITLVVLLAVGAGIFAVLSGGSGGKNHIDPKLVISPTRQDIEVTVRETGQVEPLTKIEIKSKVPGQIAALFADEGDQVQAGKILLELDRTQYRFKADSARTAHDEALAQADYAELMLRRKEQEFKAHSTSASELDLAKLDKRIAELSVQKAKLAWEAAMDDLQHCQIKSPIDGVVIHRGVETGEMVTPGVDATVEGKPLLTVADLRKLIIRCQLNQIDMAKVKKEQSVTIRFDALPGRMFSGLVQTVAPAAEQSSSGLNLFSVEVLILDHDNDVIKPGMTADVDILTARKEQVLTVPVEAVRTEDGKSSVSLVTGAPPQMATEDREVQTGLQNDRLIEVTDGLAAEDKLLIKPKSAAENELKI